LLASMRAARMEAYQFEIVRSVSLCRKSWQSRAGFGKKALRNPEGGFYQAVESGLCLGKVEVAGGCGPEHHAERAVDLEAAKPGNHPGFGVVGEKPVRVNLLRQHDGLGLAGPEPHDHVVQR